MSAGPRVVAVSCGRSHGFSKPNVLSIRLLAGLGVAGDAHAGVTVQHLSRIRRDPTQPNLRQVHLMHAELFTELRERGFDIAPGALGENVTTCGLDILALPAGTRLRLGDSATVELTGLRNPCAQIEAFRPGLLAAVLHRDAAGALIRKSGVMAVVLTEGDVRAGDAIAVERPAGAHRPLAVV